MRMEKFKEKCRDVLEEYDGDFEYDAPLDIVSAYKALKNSVRNPMIVHTNANRFGNKGYMRMTLSAQQHSRRLPKQEMDISQYTSSKIIDKSLEMSKNVGVQGGAIMPSNQSHETIEPSVNA